MDLPHSTGLQQRLAHILETARDAIVVVDAQQRIVLFNEAACHMFQRTAPQTLGQPLDLLIPSASRSAHRRQVQRFADGDGDARPMGGIRALTGVRADGSEFPIEATISRVGSAADVLMTVMVRDVTEVREAEQLRQARAAMEAANRAKNEFLSRMSHELLTPLNAVLGMAQLLHASLESRLQPSERRHFELLQAGGGQLRRLIGDVLELSRLESGDMQAHAQEIDVVTELDAVLDQQGPDAALHGLTLLRDYDASRPLKVRADPSHLRQVLGHLVSNAIRYNREGGGRVRVGALLDGHTVRVVIADNGVGMNAEQMASLYQPFNRLGRERGGTPGAGIGLALSRRLITLMGGQMKIESTPNVGTTVTVRLPDAARSPSGTLLYIEDNPVNALLVVELLRQWPELRVVVAETGAAGLEQARMLQPDLVLLDMHLPDMTGLAVLQHLQQDPATRHLPVAALSANAMPHDTASALSAGACAYWTKPIDFTAFLDNLRGLLPARAD